MTLTFLWHDYETTGIHPQKDRPLQFASIRTDANFNIIDKPTILYCKLSSDCLLQPQAALITKITPKILEQKGIYEAEFAKIINNQMRQPQTCSLGYNTIRFDDEITRNVFYRNLYDPYEREWQNHNSRWDLIDVVKAAFALRPNSLNWVFDENGFPIFKLDKLTIANAIQHENAHDALSDVYATIEIAKLLKQNQPRFYDFLLNHRFKKTALKLLELKNYKPVVHVSSKYPASKSCLAIVLALDFKPNSHNEVIVYDLSVNPEPLLNLSAEEIKKRLFISNENLPNDIERIPLKTVHLNKCPVLAPISVIRPEDEKRLNINLSLCAYHSDLIKKEIATLTQKLKKVFESSEFSVIDDVDLQLYSGGFFSKSDKEKMTEIHELSPCQLAQKSWNFDDSRLTELLFRYRARNYPETLNSFELEKWEKHCANKILKNQTNITIENYWQQIDLLKQNLQQQNLLTELEDYGKTIETKCNQTL